VTQLTFAGLDSGLSVLPRLPRGLDGNEKATMKKLIAVALILCAAIVLVAMGIICHANSEQAALWCHDHGYANYATEDGFCVGASGKLVKVGHL